MESNIPHAENKKDNNCKENCDDEEEEEGIHTHCLACHSISCNKFQRCPIVYCPEQCGVQFHKCKRTEHVKVCRHQKRPCLNSGFGCPFKVTSIELMNHLERCPANVVYCSINWNRTPLFSVVCHFFVLHLFASFLYSQSHYHVHLLSLSSTTHFWSEGNLVWLGNLNNYLLKSDISVSFININFVLSTSFCLW